MAICLTGTSNVWGGSISNKSSWGFTTGQSDCSFYSIFIGKQSIQWSNFAYSGSHNTTFKLPISFQEDYFIGQLSRYFNGTDVNPDNNNVFGCAIISINQTHIRINPSWRSNVPINAFICVIGV